MSRSDQYIGLTDKARDFLKQNACERSPCPTCGRGNGYDSKCYDVFTGMFGDEYPLMEYKLKEGDIAKEVLEDSPWFSGPMFFIKLVVSDGQYFEWGKTRINKYLLSYETDF